MRKGQLVVLHSRVIGTLHTPNRRALKLKLKIYLVFIVTNEIHVLPTVTGIGC